MAETIYMYFIKEVIKTYQPHTALHTLTIHHTHTHHLLTHTHHTPHTASHTLTIHHIPPYTHTIHTHHIIIIIIKNVYPQLLWPIVLDNTRAHVLSCAYKNIYNKYFTYIK